MEFSFRVIEIEKFVMSVLTGFLVGLFIHFLFRPASYLVYFYFALIPVLYWLYCGKVSVEVSATSIRVKWLKKPLFAPGKDIEMPFSEIIRWKYQSSSRGPDSLVIISASAEKIRLRPDIFSLNNNAENAILELDKRVTIYNSQKSVPALLQKIKTSVYLKRLLRKIAVLQKLKITVMFLMMLSLLLGVILKEEGWINLVWVIFSLLFLFLSITVFYRHFLKIELKDCLRLEKH